MAMAAMTSFLGYDRNQTQDSDSGNHATATARKTGAVIRVEKQRSGTKG